MYTGLGIAEERQELMEERRQERLEIRQAATTEYPGLPPSEAVKRYEAKLEAEQTTAGITREYWPVLIAFAAGLVLLTFLRR